MNKRGFILPAVLLATLVLSIGLMRSVTTHAASYSRALSAHTQTAASSAHVVNRNARADTCAEAIGLGVVGGLIENSIPGFAPTSPIDIGGFGNITDCTP